MAARFTSFHRCNCGVGMIMIKINYHAPCLNYCVIERWRGSGTTTVGGIAGNILSEIFAIFSFLDILIIWKMKSVIEHENSRETADSFVRSRGRRRCLDRCHPLPGDHIKSQKPLHNSYSYLRRRNIRWHHWHRWHTQVCQQLISK